MKNYINKMLVVGLLTFSLLAIQKTQAAVIAISSAAAVTNAFLQGPLEVSSITLGNPSAAAITVRLFNAPTNSFTYGYAAYTNITRALNSVAVTNTYVSPTGATNQTIYPIGTLIVSTTNSVIGATNNYPIFGQWTVAAADSLVIPFDPPVFVSQGLTLTNGGGTNVSVTVVYSKKGS